jgi:hypothetical protein
MTLAWREFPTGEVALFREPNSSGSDHDINAARNAPAKTPASHLSSIFFHSGLDLLEVAHVATVTVNHAAVSSSSGIGGSNAGQSQAFKWGTSTADHLLVDLTSWGLTKEPICLVAANGSILSGAQPVQTDTAGRGRYVTAYSETTGIYLFEEASQAGSSLAATSIDYTVWVLREPPGAVGDKLREFDPDTGEVTLGYGRFASLRRYAQVSVGGSPFALRKGRSIDLDCGAPRFLRAGLSNFEPVPSALTLTILPGTGAYGSSLAYAGSFAGSGALQVKAP